LLTTAHNCSQLLSTANRSLQPLKRTGPKLAEKIKIEGNWGLEGDANKMWEEMTDCARRSAKEVLGVSKGGSGRMRGA